MEDESKTMQEEEQNSLSPPPPQPSDDKFPQGLRVLAVDDNNVCLRLLERLLLACHYNVTLSREADATIELLKENKDKFDIVITDVHMTEKCDGFKLLETIGLELDIPVVMVSSDDNVDLVRKAIEHGACDYLVKPVRLQEIKNIWQHVIRKAKDGRRKTGSTNTIKVEKLTTTTEPSKAVKREREEADKEDEVDLSEANASKRPRFNWTQERHARFCAIVSELGADNAAPSKILEKMNIPGLTRQQVASHLQKFRSGIKKTKFDMGIRPSGIDLERVQNTHLMINDRGILQVGQQVHRPHYLNRLNSLVHVLPQTIHTLNQYNEPSPYGGHIPSNSYNYHPRTLSIPNVYPNFVHTSPGIPSSTYPSYGELTPSYAPRDMGAISRTDSFHFDEIFPDRTINEEFDIQDFEETTSTREFTNNTMEEQDLDFEYLFQQNNTTNPDDEDDINAIINDTLQGIR